MARCDTHGNCVLTSIDLGFDGMSLLAIATIVLYGTCIPATDYWSSRVVLVRSPVCAGFLKGLLTPLHTLQNAMKDTAMDG